MGVRKIANGDYYLRHVCPSAWNNLARTGNIFINFYACEFFENLSKNFKFPQNLTRITGTLYVKTNAHFLSHRGQFYLTRRNASGRSCKENQNTHFTFRNYLLFSKIIPFMK